MVPMCSTPRHMMVMVVMVVVVVVTVMPVAGVHGGAASASTIVQRGKGLVQPGAVAHNIVGDAHHPSQDTVTGTVVCEVVQRIHSVREHHVCIIECPFHL